MLRTEKTFHPPWTWNSFSLPIFHSLRSGRIGFKSWGILTVGPFVLFFFFMSASSRLAHEQTSIHTYPILFHGFTVYDQRASMWICVSPRELLAGRTGPMGSGVPREWAIKTVETLNQPLWLKTSLISAQPQLTVFPSYSDEPEKPKSDEEVVCTCFVFFLDGIGIERFHRVALVKRIPLAWLCQQYHSRNCVTKCLQTKQILSFLH